MGRAKASDNPGFDTIDDAGNFRAAPGQTDVETSISLRLIMILFVAVGVPLAFVSLLARSWSDEQMAVFVTALGLTSLSLAGVVFVRLKLRRRVVDSLGQLLYRFGGEYALRDRRRNASGFSIGLYCSFVVATGVIVNGLITLHQPSSLGVLCCVTYLSVATVFILSFTAYDAIARAAELEIYADGIVSRGHGAFRWRQLAGYDIVNCNLADYEHLLLYLAVRNPIERLRGRIVLAALEHVQQIDAHLSRHLSRGVPPVPHPFR